jgi:hypothetical protein
MVSKEEYNSYIKALADAEQTPTSKEFPFDSISKKISFLEMFCKIIDNHPEELEDSYRKVHEERGMKPSGTLIDYFLLNIHMFYECAKRKFKLNDSEMPGTYKMVKRFRNKVMAHFDEKIKTNAELVKEYIRVNGKDAKGWDRIWLDYVSFRDKIFDRLKDETTNN